MEQPAFRIHTREEILAYIDWLTKLPRERHPVRPLKELPWDEQKEYLRFLPPITCLQDADFSCRVEDLHYYWFGGKMIVMSGHDYFMMI